MLLLPHGDASLLPRRERPRRRREDCRAPWPRSGSGPARRAGTRLLCRRRPSALNRLPHRPLVPDGPGRAAVSPSGAPTGPVSRQGDSPAFFRRHAPRQPPRPPLLSSECQRRRDSSSTGRSTANTDARPPRPAGGRPRPRAWRGQPQSVIPETPAAPWPAGRRRHASWQEEVCGQPQPPWTHAGPCRGATRGVRAAAVAPECPAQGSGQPCTATPPRSSGRGCAGPGRGGQGLPGTSCPQTLGPPYTEQNPAPRLVPQCAPHHPEGLG